MTDVKSRKIQILKGLAIIAVVFIHNTPVGLTQVFCRPFLNFSVGLFLFFSGMLSNAEKWNPKKRLAKVLIPYILWSAVYVLIYNYKTPSRLPAIFFNHLLTGRAAGIMYYIFVYCGFTLLIPLIDKLAKSKYRYLGFLISPAEILIVRLIPLLTGYTLSEYTGVITELSCFGWFTYFYLGYLLGNNLITVKASTKKLVCLWAVSIVIQILEGYWYYSLGSGNCGTQQKLSSFLTGAIFALMAYRFVNSPKVYDLKYLKLLGDCSFGIYFSHPAVMFALGKLIPHYSHYITYPFNAVITVLASLGFVLVGRKLLGKYGKYLALY